MNVCHPLAAAARQRSGIGLRLLWLLAAVALGLGSA